MSDKKCVRDMVASGEDSSSQDKAKDNILEVCIHKRIHNQTYAVATKMPAWVS